MNSLIIWVDSISSWNSCIREPFLPPPPLFISFSWDIGLSPPPPYQHTATTTPNPLLDKNPVGSDDASNPDLQLTRTIVQNIFVCNGCYRILSSTLVPWIREKSKNNIGHAHHLHKFYSNVLFVVKNAIQVNMLMTTKIECFSTSYIGTVCIQSKSCQQNFWGKIHSFRPQPCIWLDCLCFHVLVEEDLSKRHVLFDKNCTF